MRDLGMTPKKIAILVIAGLNQPLYIHYIKTHWAELIKHTNRNIAHIDIFMLLENGMDRRYFEHIAGNVIEDDVENLNTLCNPKYRNLIVPGILSKTIYAFDILKDRYDVFFRTNLSSFIKVTNFNAFIQEKMEICYSGAWVWQDALRSDLLRHNRIGADKSIKSLDELQDYPGNTFVSGAGYLLSAAEVKSLIDRRGLIRFDIVDDVSVGLMFEKHEILHGFSLIIEPNRSPAEIAQTMRETSCSHIRLQHFPLGLAEAVWDEIKDEAIWT